MDAIHFNIHPQNIRDALELVHAGAVNLAQIVLMLNFECGLIKLNMAGLSLKV